MPCNTHYMPTMLNILVDNSIVNNKGDTENKVSQSYLVWMYVLLTVKFLLPLVWPDLLLLANQWHCSYAFINCIACAASTRRTAVSAELESMWMDVLATCFKKLSQYISGVTVVNYKKPWLDEPIFRPSIRANDATTMFRTYYLICTCPQLRGIHVPHN